jgi:hypothetical protein
MYHYLYRSVTDAALGTTSAGIYRIVWIEGSAGTLPQEAVGARVWLFVESGGLRWDGVRHIALVFGLGIVDRGRGGIANRRRSTYRIVRRADFQVRKPWVAIARRM